MSAVEAELFPDLPRVEVRSSYRLKLVNAADIGAALGLTAERVRQLHADGSGPEPCGVVGRAVGREVHVWEWADVEAWAAEVGRAVVVPP